jgi:hypothetical protein
MKHGAYNMSHKEKDKAQSGETQIHLPQRNLMPSLLKKKTMLIAFINRRGAGNKELFQRVKM